MEAAGDVVARVDVDTNVIDKLAGLFASDAILPSQFNDMARRSSIEPPIAKLILTVLEDGVRCFLGHADRVFDGNSAIGGYQVSRRRARLQAEAADWVFDYTAEEPFSFNWICDAMNLSRDYFREQLQQRAQGGRNLPRRSPVINQKAVGRGV
jgi:hypothetical protein